MKGLTTWTTMFSDHPDNRDREHQQSNLQKNDSLRQFKDCKKKINHGILQNIYPEQQTAKKIPTTTNLQKNANVINNLQNCLREQQFTKNILYNNLQKLCLKQQFAKLEINGPQSQFPKSCLK